MKSNFDEIAQQTNKQLEGLFKKYHFQDSTSLKCECSSQMEFLCVSKCGNPSLFCNNRNCLLSLSKHKKCKILFIEGLTEKLKVRIDCQKIFLTQLFTIQEKIIAQIRSRRYKLINQFIFSDFSSQQIQSIRQIFMNQNKKFMNGYNLEQFYQKDVEVYQNKIDEKILQQYTSMLNKLKNQLLNKTQIIMNLRKFQKMPDTDSILFKSNILTSNLQAETIKGWLNNPRYINLLFRASQNQFSTAKFHQKCDRIGNILVLAKTEFGKIIGGFNSIGWDSIAHDRLMFIKKEQCFIFSIDLRQKMHLLRPTFCIQNNQEFGPFFGPDLFKMAILIASNTRFFRWQNDLYCIFWLLIIHIRNIYKKVSGFIEIVNNKAFTDKRLILIHQSQYLQIH